MTVLPEDIFKVVLAVLVGGLIGAEREFRDKAAGFRTLILICVGASFFTMLAMKVGNTIIAASIITGVGFLGAGVIMRESGRVTGLTTAAMIWLTASLGMGLGLGQYGPVGVVTGITLVVLWAFPLLENHLDRTWEHLTYEIVLPGSPEKLSAIEGLFARYGLRAKRQAQCKEGERMRCTWDARGRPQAHTRLQQALLADPEVQEYRV